MKINEILQTLPNLTEITISDPELSCHTESFLPAEDEHLFVFRQIIDIPADCVFSMTSSIEDPGAECIWALLEYQEHENNACGMVLQNKENGEIIFVCEQTQIMSVSMRVTEDRENCRHTYQITAFKDSPVKLEKFVSCFRQGETEDYLETAFKACRAAAISGFASFQNRRK